MMFYLLLLLSINGNDALLLSKNQHSQPGMAMCIPNQDGTKIDGPLVGIDSKFGNNPSMSHVLLYMEILTQDSCVTKTEDEIKI